MNETPRLFVSVFAYVMGKEVEDLGAAVRDEIEAGAAASWPGFRTLARVRAQMAPIVLSVNHSSLIAKARSLAMGAFLESGAPLWLSIDDDVEAPAEDLAKLLGPLDVDVLIAPCALRTERGAPAQLNLVAEKGTVLRDLGTRRGVPVRGFAIESGGLALSVVTRAAAEQLDAAHPELRFLDHGRRGLGAFLEEVREGAWHGEDFAFCRRARALGLRIDALWDTSITHAGVTATVDPRFFVRSDRLD